MNEVELAFEENYERFLEQQEGTRLTYVAHNSSRDCDGGHSYTHSGFLDEYGSAFAEDDDGLERAFRKMIGLAITLPWDTREEYTYSIKPVLREFPLSEDGFSRAVIIGYEYAYSQSTEEGYSSYAVSVLQDPWDDAHYGPVDDVVYDQYAQQAGY